MKTILTILNLAILTCAASAAAPAVGSVSTNQSFARNSGSGFANTSLDDYEGKILIVMMMTPWCPICQSHAQAVGNGLLDHFDDASRGSLRGKNDNGVPIQSILLSTEEAATWDSVNESFSTTNGFKQWGLDANAQRDNPRRSLGYYRGGFINSSNLYDWGNDRRRLVVLSLVRNSASHSFREIVINQNTYSSGNNAAARAAINGVTPAAVASPPRIEVARTPGSALVNGTSTINFGNVDPGSASKVTFTIRNGGGGNLTGIAATLTGVQPADYQLSAPADTVLAPDETTTFSVTFSPLAMGPRQAMVNVRSDADGVSSFVFNLTGTSGMPVPEIRVRQQNGPDLLDGRTKRAFGTAKIRGKGRSVSFIISNTGDANLTGLRISKSGKNPRDFIVNAPSQTTLAPGASSRIKVTFQPRGKGTRAASLQVWSNDADESPFHVKVSGLGIRP